MKLSIITVNLNNLEGLKKKTLNVYRKYGISFVLFILMFVNIMYMHYVVQTDDFQHTYRYWRYKVPLIFACFDILAMLLFFALVTWKRRKPTYILAYVFVGFLVLANVVYSRFFHAYFSPNVLSEISNFKGSWWFGYVEDAFRWTDMLLVVTTIVFIYCLRKNNWCKMRVNVMALVLFILLVCGSQVLMDARNDDLKDFSSLLDRHVGKIFKDVYTINPRIAVLSCGLIRTQVICDMLTGTRFNSLDATEIKEIDSYLDRRTADLGSQYDGTSVSDCPNIVFILVESYLSVVSDLSVNGKEVTPYLNELKRCGGGYFNGYMKSCINTGESSDAQVIYFAGLIPLTKDMAITYITRDSIVGLPKLLHEQKGYSTYMTIPTSLDVWHQEEANIKYGIGTTYSTVQYDQLSWANDSVTFAIASDKQKQMTEPFFHAILSFSMHSPYDKDRFPKIDDLVFPDSYPTAYQNYLKCCHYTDRQIGRYIEDLKSSGQYDNTIIIIAADHQAHAEFLHVPKEDLNNLNLPIYIINSGINIDNAYNGEILQIDLYPSLMDMFGLKSDFRGFGHSILRQNYRCELTDEARNISGRILTGNYFGHKIQNGSK